MTTSPEVNATSVPASRRKPTVAEPRRTDSPELIAESSGFVSVALHSPVDGTVTAIDLFDHRYYSRKKRAGIVIEVGKVKDAWIDLAEPQIYYLEAEGDGRSIMVPFDFGSNYVEVTAGAQHARKARLYRQTEFQIAVA